MCMLLEYDENWNLIKSKVDDKFMKDIDITTMWGYFSNKVCNLINL